MVSGVLAARILGVEDRGYLALFALFPAVLSQVGSLGLPLALTYQLSREPKRAAAAVRVLRAPALLQAVALTAVHAAILIGVFADDPGDVRRVALLSLAGVPIALAQAYGLAILQGEQRFAAFNVFRTLPALLYSVVVAVLFVSGSGSLGSVTAAWLATAAVAAAATLAAALRALPAREAEPGGVPRNRLIRFGLKGLLGWTSPVETFRLDQAVVGLLLSPASLGLYVVGLAFANLPRFIGQSIGYVAYPRVASQGDDERGRAELWQFFWVSVAVCALVIGALELAAGKLVPLFFGEEFSGAVGVTRILLVSGLFLAARRVLTDGAQGLGRPGLGTAAEVASWVALLPALAVFTPLFGVEGVALALTVSSGVSLAVLASLVSARGAAGPVGESRLSVRGASR